MNDGLWDGMGTILQVGSLRKLTLVVNRRKVPAFFLVPGLTHMAKAEERPLSSAKYRFCLSVIQFQRRVCYGEPTTGHNNMFMPSFQFGHCSRTLYLITLPKMSFVAPPIIIF
jgi:hypothetical protein